MSTPRQNLLVEKNIQASMWEDTFGMLTCLFVFLLPFFPDEKISRTKMLVLESGILGLVFLWGLRFFHLGFSSANSPPRKEASNKNSSPLILLTVLFFGWILAQAGLLFFSSDKALAISEFRRVLLGFGAFLFFTWAGFDSLWRQRIFITWTLAATLLSIYGLMQYRGGWGPIQVPQMERIMGTYGNPIFFAAFLLGSLFISLSALSLQKNFAGKVFFISSIALVLTALYLTKTRAAWVALFTTLLLGSIFFVRKGIFSKKIILFLLLFVGIFTFKVRETFSRDQGHLLIWRDTLRMAIDHPIIGVGLGAFHTGFPSYAKEDLVSKWPKGQFIVNYAHNEFLQQFAEGGLLGLLSFLAPVGFFFFSIFQFLHREEKGKTNFSLLFLSLGALALFIQNFFSVDMRFGVSFASCFMLMGLASSSIDTKNSHKKSPGTNLPLRLTFGIVWVGFFVFVLIPALLKPYRAQKEVQQMTDFFDQRLLDPAKSIQDLEALVRTYPKESAVLEKLAYVYAKEMRTVDNKVNLAMAESAISTYKKLIEMDPQRFSAFNNLANIYYTLGKSDEAISLWKKCVEIKPDFLDAHLNLGKTLYVRGDLKESADHFQKVQQLDPGNAEAIVYLKRMVE